MKQLRPSSSTKALRYVSSGLCFFKVTLQPWPRPYFVEQQVLKCSWWHVLYVNQMPVEHSSMFDVYAATEICQRNIKCAL